MARCSRDATNTEGGEYGMVALVCEPDRLPSLIETIHDFLGHGVGEGGRDDSASHTPPIEQVVIANINSKNQIVLSGSIEKIQALLVNLRQFGGHDPRAVRLATDSPFHSPIMAPAEKMMRDLLDETEIGFEQALFPCVSNVSARPFGSVQQLKVLLSRQSVDTVRWFVHFAVIPSYFEPGLELQCMLREQKKFAPGTCFYYPDTWLEEAKLISNCT